MNLSAISAGLGFKGNLPKLPPDMEWAKDPGCPEGGLYPRKKSQFERQPEIDGFESPSKNISVANRDCDCEECGGETRHYSYTADGRRETWEG